MQEVDFKDRVPTHKGRIKLTPINGQTDFFTMERADEPTEEGTPLDKATFDSITQSRLTGRFYEPIILKEQNAAYSSEVYNIAFEIKVGVPLEWTKGQRITIQIYGLDTTLTIAENTLNNIQINTILQNNRRYELVYNGTSFDVKEM